jgi:hypothetical protein
MSSVTVTEFFDKVNVEIFCNNSTFNITFSSYLNEIIEYGENLEYRKYTSPKVLIRYEFKNNKNILDIYNGINTKYLSIHVEEYKMSEEYSHINFHDIYIIEIDRETHEVVDRFDRLKNKGIKIEQRKTIKIKSARKNIF